VPTTRGWSIGGIGLLLWLGGRAYGSRPLEQVGFALVALLFVAVGVVRLGRHELHVSRRVTPERARAGRPVRVTLNFHNRGSGPAPLLLMEDRVPAEVSGRARFTLRGIEPGGKRETSYQLRPQARGRYVVGPLTVTVVDPFGLARSSSPTALETVFLVHPQTESLALPRDLGERRTAASSALKQPTGARGEDFYTLREYGEGDDLRKIHWPSTAKQGKYMIRQEETPWHTRSTIVLDDRRSAHEGVGESSSFERSIQAAASLLLLYDRTGYGFKLATAHRAGVGTGKGLEHLHRAMDMLAVVQASGARDGDESLVARLTEIEARGIAEETLVLVCGHLDAQAAVALARCRRLYRQVLAVTFPPHRFGSGTTKQRWEGERETVDATSLLGRSGVRTLVLGPGEALGPAWGALSSGRLRGGDPAWARKPELV
jgi:uncharacterized protein (DUF58 family)